MEAKMKLDEKGVQSLLDHIKKHWGVKGQCPRCYKSNDYIADDIKIFTLMEYSGGGLQIGPQSTQLPVIPIICKSCGHVDFLRVEFLDKKEEEKDNVS